MIGYNLSKRWDYQSDSTFFLTGVTLGQGGLGELVIKDRQTGNTFCISYAQGGVGISKSFIGLPKIENLIPKIIHDSTIKSILAQLPSGKGGIIVKTFFGDDDEPLSLFTECQGFDIAQFKAGFGIAGAINIYFFYRSGFPKIGPWTELVFSVSASADLPKGQILGGVGHILSVTSS